MPMLGSMPSSSINAIGRQAEFELCDGAKCKTTIDRVAVTLELLSEAAVVVEERSKKIFVLNPDNHVVPVIF